MKLNYDTLGKYIKLIDVRNRDLTVEKLLGVSITKQFIPSIANTVGTDFSSYKVVKRDQFAYGPVTSRNGDKMSIALMDDDECIISSSYLVFKVIDTKRLLPEYLMLWFKRPEFDRYARFKSHGSVREIFDWDEMCKVKLPVPDISVQRSIIQAYNTLERRIHVKQQINDNLEATATAVYKAWFIDRIPFTEQPQKDSPFGEIPESWQTGILNDVCDLINGRAYSQDELLSSGKYRVLRVGNFFTQSSWYYSDLELENDKYCVEDDLLFCWSASFGLYIWNNTKTIFHYHIWKIGFDKTDRSYREFIYLFLKQEVEHLKREGHGSIMAHLTKEGVEKIALAIPPKSVIAAFHDLILPIIEQQKAIEREVTRLQALQDVLLAKMSA